jgi:hypothetical protein
MPKLGSLSILPISRSGITTRWPRKCSDCIRCPYKWITTPMLRPWRKRSWGAGRGCSSANMPVRLGEDENGPGTGNQPYLRYNHQHTSVSRNSVHDKAAQLDQPVQKGQARRRRAGYQDIPVGQKGRQNRRNHDRKIRADVEPPPGILRSTGLPIRLMNVCFLDCAVCEQCASWCGKSSEARNVF